MPAKPAGMPALILVALLASLASPTLHCVQTRCAPTDPSCDFSSAIFGYLYLPSEPRFVAAGATGSVYISRDGETWSANSGPGSGSLQGVVLQDGLLLAQGFSAGTYVSHDSGSTWTANTIAGGGTLASTTYFKGRYYVANFGGAPTLFYSNDGYSWIAGPTLGAMNDYERSAVHQDRLYIVDSGGNLAFTSDGLNWTGPLAFGGSDSDSLAGNGAVLVISDDTDLFRSTDNQNFSSVLSFSSASLAVTVFQEKFVAFGDNTGTDSLVYVSADGLTWTQTATLTGILIAEAVGGPDRIVAVGAGNLCNSADAITWQCELLAPAPQVVNFGYLDTGLQEDLTDLVERR